MAASMVLLCLLQGEGGVGHELFGRLPIAWINRGSRAQAHGPDAIAKIDVDGGKFGRNAADVFGSRRRRVLHREHDGKLVAVDTCNEALLRKTVPENLRDGTDDRIAAILTQSNLQPAYGSYLKRTVSAEDLAAIAERVTEIYKEAGFSLSRAIVPPQDIEEGHLRIQVIEGYIDDVVVISDQQDFGVRDLLLPLLRERPLRQQTLERHLLIASGTPGIRIADTAVDEIGTLTGRFRLSVSLEAWRMFLGAGVDNRGSSAVGPIQGYIAPAFNSLAVPGDLLDFTVSSVPDQPHELRFARAGYGIPIGNNGARVSVNVSYGEVWPGDVRRRVENVTETLRFELKGTIVPLRTRDASVWVSVAGSLEDVREHDDSGTVSDDHVRVLSAAVDTELRDRYEGSNYLTLSVRQGFNAFGASESGDPWLSRSDASGDFTVVNVLYSRFQKINETWSFNFRAAGQFASTPLLASEEFYLGGSQFGRAYDGGTISGDSALAGSIEIRYDQSVDDRRLKGYQLYGFADHGVAWDLSPGADERYALTSAGAGLRLFFADDLEGSVELAVPVDRAWYLDETRDLSVYFSLSKSLRLCPSRSSLRCPKT